MSGAEALGAIGVIANILALIDFSVDVYERAKDFSNDVNDIPKAFRNTSEVLPLVKSALQQTEKRMKDGEIDVETCQALRKVLDGCEATVVKLKDIFHNVLPPKDVSKWTRGWKAISSVSQNKKVEDLDKALMRFVEVLTLYHSSQSLSTAQLTQALDNSTPQIDNQARAPLFIVRYQQEEYFIGREGIMLEISKRFERKAPRVAITGIGGVGKSRIAIEYCYQYRDQNANSDIFWVFGGKRSRLVAAYYEIAEKIQIPGFDKPNVNILTLVSDWLSDEKNGSWLMILDNADDADVWISSTEGPLTNYLPRGKHGSMLITTRNAQLGKTISNVGKKPIDIPILGSDDSITLLRSKVSEDDILTDGDSKEITQLLGCLPLAITQAAAYLDQNEISVVEYLVLLKSSKADTSDLLIRESHDDSRDPDIQNSVFHTWKISFDQISQQHPRAASILSTMALLDRQAISIDLLREKEEGELEFREAMQKLKAYSLITEGLKDKIFSMHRIVQLSIQWYLKTQDSLEKWQEKALECVESCFPETRDIKLIESLHPHIQVVISYNYNTQASKVLYSSLVYFLACYNFVLSRWSLAIKQGSESLKIRESVLGLEHEDTIQGMMILGRSLIHEGGRHNHDQAQKLLHKALELSEKKLPYLHILSLKFIAELLLNQGNINQSEKLHRQILRINTKEDDPESLSDSYTLYTFASLYRAQKRYSEAENLARKALETAETHCEKDFEFWMYMQLLAIILRHQKKYTEELHLRRKILSFLNELLGPLHPKSLETRIALVRCLKNSGDYVEAEEVGRESVRLVADVLDIEDKLTLRTMEMLGEVLSSQERYEEAFQLHREVLALMTKTLGADHKSTLHSMSRVGYNLRMLKRYNEAESIQQQALARCIAKLGNNHKTTLKTMHDFGKTLFHLGKVDEGKELLDRALQLHIEVYGLEGEKTLLIKELLDSYING